MCTIIEVNDKTYSLRLKSRHVKEVQEKLGKSFSDAIFDLMDNPVQMTVPFLWGILKSQNSNKSEYDLYDDLVDEGYGPSEFAELVLDICEASGFFTEAQRKGMRRLPEAMDKMNVKAMETMVKTFERVGLNQKPLTSVTEPASPTVIPLKNSGTAPMEKPSTGSKKRSNARVTKSEKADT